MRWLHRYIGYIFVVFVVAIVVFSIAYILGVRFD